MKVIRYMPGTEIEELKGDPDLLKQIDEQRH
jgi:hypothetical protein